MKQYRVINTETQESQVINANTKLQAAEMSGWFMGGVQVLEINKLTGEKTIDCILL